ncbi:hypothetical protein AaE_008795 [Aphanomyces astaci]|uniref:Uncharacterized protein n=1 Tax=Aphanomyces astaci TaxID=112090 RepID=A0A6A5A6R0_APHAT|nr:hypothetical protein AaE_008795 [Aphanomyces astaci]
MMMATVLGRSLIRKQKATTAAVAASWTRRFSSHPSDDWETITRRNGMYYLLLYWQTVYYNRVTKESTRTNPFSSGKVLPSSSPAIPSTASTSALPVVDAPQDSTNAVEEAVVYTPIDFSKAAQIVGQESQLYVSLALITLEPNQKLRAESGAMIYMTDGVHLDTHTAGGVQQGLKRIMTGENFFVTEYTYTGTTSGQVCLGTSVPSKVRPNGTNIPMTSHTHILFPSAFHL